MELHAPHRCRRPAGLSCSYTLTRGLSGSSCWPPRGEVGYVGPVCEPDLYITSHVWSVVCSSGYFLPLGLPYQFLPLPLLGLSVEAEKSERQVLVGYRLYVFMR